MYRNSFHTSDDNNLRHKTDTDNRSQLNVKRSIGHKGTNKRQINKAGNNFDLITSEVDNNILTDKEGN